MALFVQAMIPNTVFQDKSRMAMNLYMAPQYVDGIVLIDVSPTLISKQDM